MFRFGREQSIRKVSDGMSKTLMIGEFVHRDATGIWMQAPGNVRPWLYGHNGSEGATMGVYTFKILEFQPNTRIERVADGVVFNYLPMGSFHSGVTNFAQGDGAVRAVTDQVDFNVYQAYGTVSGDEVVNADF